MLKRGLTAFALILILILGAWGYRQYIEKFLITGIYKHNMIGLFINWCLT